MADWPMTTIGQLTELVTKGTTPTSVGHKFTENGINFVKVETITQNGQFRPNRFAHIDALCNEALKRSRLAEGDILFSIAGALGRTAIVTADILPANTNQALAIIRLRPEANVLPSYILHVLSSGMLIEQIEKQKGGVAQQNLSLAQVKGFNIPLPDLFEQKRIVAILDEAFEGIDAAIANTQKNLTNARELFESYLNNIFTQKGDGWVETNIGQEVELLTGFAFKSKEYSDAPDAVTLIRGDNILQGQFRWRAVKKWPKNRVDEFEKFKLAENDIVLAMDRTWVKAGLKYAKVTSDDLPCLLLQRVARLRAKKQFHEDFLYHLIGSKLFTDYVLSIQTGLGVPHISGKQILAFSFSLPHLEKQREIIQHLNELSAKTQRLETIYQQKLDALAELKQSILQKAFSGELTSGEIAA